MGRHKKNWQSQTADELAGASEVRWLWRGAEVLALAGIALTSYFVFFSNATPAVSAPVAKRKAQNIDQLLAMTPEQLANVDIAEMNLLCATGLSGAENLDIDQCLDTLDRWAERVRKETERHLYRLTDPEYKQEAEYIQHSEARFRAAWLVSVLQEDIGAHYYSGFVPQDVEVPPIQTSKETFIHGLMDHDDAHKAFGGNCVSLPVAYAAVGRRLGYPIKIVCAKEHSFCRWEGLGHTNPAWRDRFNFDGAGKGFSIDPDEFYVSWPRKSTPDQILLAGWLKSLTPQQELALFVATRGHVLTSVKQDYLNAQLAYAHAVRLWPTSVQMLQWLSVTTTKIYEQQLAAHPEAFRQMAERNRGANEAWPRVK